MAVAQIIFTSIKPTTTITQQGLLDFIKSGLISAGLTFVSEYTASNNKFLVFSATGAETGKTYNTVFYRVQVTSALIVSHQLFTTWNTANNTGTDGSGEVNSTAFVNSTEISAVTLIGGTEFKFLALLQGSVFILLGVFIPQNHFEVYDINSFPKAVISQNSTLSNWSGCSRNAFGNTNYECFPVGWQRLASANSQYNVFAPMVGLFFGSHSNQGVMFWSSNNFGIAPGNNIPRLTIFTSPAANGGSKDCLMLGSGAGAFIVEVNNA